jgi:uncharacterized protein
LTTLKLPVTLRTCIVTKAKFPKAELVRITLYNDIVSVDLYGKNNGRGVYLKPDIEVLDEAFKRNSLERGLKLRNKITNEDRERIKKEFEKVLGDKK